MKTKIEFTRIKEWKKTSVLLELIRFFPSS